MIEFDAALCRGRPWRLALFSASGVQLAQPCTPRFFMGKQRKPGRNQPCPCGSGQKHKRCCMVSPKPVIPPMAFMVADANLHRINEQNRKQKFGDVRKLVHTEHQGQKVVAVGSEVHFGDWKTPVDFLGDYIKRVLTPKWGKAELKKPFAERHPLLQWYDSLCKLGSQQTSDADGVYGMMPNGAALSYLLVAYDLFTVRQHAALQASLVKRLRHKGNFQGARYELYAIATCIRAGCDIEFEDESDGSRRHVELTATHRATGQKLALEAKSRHLPGILGRDGERVPDEQVRVKIRHLISDAIDKPTSEPFVIFLDLNLPPTSAEPLSQEWFDKIGDPVIKEFGETAGHDPWNMLLFTNSPHHYGDDSAIAPTGNVVGLLGKNPKVAMQNPEVLNVVFEAARKFGNLPNSFEEM